MTISPISTGMTDVVLLANVINGIGVFGLLFAHYLIARSQARNGFIFSALGGAFVSVGSALLLSWPVVFLNVVWLAIGVVGFLRSSPGSAQSPKRTTVNDLIYVSTYCILLIVLCAGSMVYGHGFGAWSATGFYLSSFALLSIGQIQTRHYLFICLLGYLLLIEHLIITENYAVFANETLGALIGLFGILSYYLKSWSKSRKPETSEPTEA